jgi:hypothetical protein
MMDAFTAVLEARDPEQNHFRSYGIEAGTDLFGVWLVGVMYGRIGSACNAEVPLQRGSVPATRPPRHGLLA